jgi:hypothetical protein
MECHATIGTTVDQTFAFARNVTGVDGWGHINLKGMPDLPPVDGFREEIASHLETVGGGNEFGENTKIVERLFTPEGRLDPQAISGLDGYQLTSPSVRRALDLKKAYLTIVEDQVFIHGRDASITPAENAYREVAEGAPALPAEKVRSWDIRLKWSESPRREQPLNNLPQKLSGR